MYKVGICGHFGGEKKYSDGQTVKTVSLYDELVYCYGVENVVKMDTYGGLKKLPVHIFNLIGLLIKCENVIILPAQNSLRIFSPILAITNILFRRRLIYVVIGGWLPAFIEKKRILRNCLKRFDYILTETNTMKEKLISQNFFNVAILNNFKRLPILNTEDLIMKTSQPLKSLIFSRVMKEKGIEDAVWAVNELNKNKNRVKLDIYGPIDSNYLKDFESLKERFGDLIQYKGIVKPFQSVSVLRNYDLLLFPTLFFTEGIPGTIIDAYSAGIPVISSKWLSYDDVVIEGKTGLGYSFGDKEALKELLEKIITHPNILVSMKKTCIHKAYEYTPEYVMNKLKKILDGEV